MSAGSETPASDGPRAGAPSTEAPSIEALAIRPMDAAHFDAFWPIFETVVRAGETYTYDVDTDRATARRLWLQTPRETWVAIADGEVLGSYYLKTNAAGGGAHVCNCGYMVAPAARGRGIARALCEHSMARARTLGYRAMQFNAVVASNSGAVRLWQRLGFAIVGTVPGAFAHPSLGEVDLHVMHRHLDG